MAVMKCSTTRWYLSSLIDTFRLIIVSKKNCRSLCVLSSSRIEQPNYLNRRYNIPSFTFASVNVRYHYILEIKKTRYAHARTTVSLHTFFLTVTGYLMVENELFQRPGDPHLENGPKTRYQRQRPRKNKSRWCLPLHFIFMKSTTTSVCISATNDHGTQLRARRYSTCTSDQDCTKTCRKREEKTERVHNTTTSALRLVWIMHYATDKERRKGGRICHPSNNKKKSTNPVSSIDVFCLLTVSATCLWPNFSDGAFVFFYFFFILGIFSWCGNS